MAYQKQTYQDGVTEYTDTLFEHMDDGIFGAYPVQLIAISDTAPSQCVENDKYYNTSTKKIYTATGTNTWGTNGETPLVDTSYWLISENGNYAWDGNDLVSIGGGKAEVIISDTEPEEGKLWVDTAEIQTIAGRDRLVNVSNEVDEDYRTNILKGNWDYSTSPLVSYGTSKSNITNGIRITCTQSAQNIGSYMEIPIQLLGKTTKFNVEITPSASNKGRILFAYLNNTNDIVSSIITINESGSYDITFASSLPSGATKIGALFYGNSNGTASINDYVDYTNIKLWNGEASIVVDNDEIYSKDNIDKLLTFDDRIDDRTYTMFLNTSSSSSFGITIKGGIDRHAFLVMGVNNAIGSILSIITSSSSTTNVKNLGTVNLSASRSGNNISVSGMGTYTYVYVIGYDDFTLYR